MSQPYLTPQTWQQWDNIIHQSISNIIVLVFIHPIQILFDEAMLLLNLCLILRTRCPQQDRFHQNNIPWLHQNTLDPGSKKNLKVKFSVPNPLDNISMPVMA